MQLAADSWQDFVAELRLRFPLLARHILTPSGELIHGFVIVINDEAVPAGGVRKLGDGDEVSIIVALAGG
jgi:molybdopterin converting factor small subunit